MDIVVLVLTCCVIVTVIVHCAWILVKLKRISLLALGPIFERSSNLMIFGILANLFESVFNVICGYIYYINGNIIDDRLITLLFFIIFSCRLYASCMFFRILRIFMLNKFRKGEVSRKFLRTVSTYKLVFIASIVYAATTATIITTVVAFHDMQYIFIPKLCSTCYAFESFFLLIMSIASLTTMAHPTLSVEYFIYSLIWVTGSFSYQKSFETRWMFYIPIRNNVLIFISLTALKRHKDVVRPPLPSEINYREILEIEELYIDFERFVKKTSDEKLIFACNALKEFAKGRFFEDYSVVDVDSTELKSFFDVSLEEMIEDKQYENLVEYLKDMLKPVLAGYLESIQFFSFKRQFFIEFN